MKTLTLLLSLCAGIFTACGETATTSKSAATSDPSSLIKEFDGKTTVKLTKGEWKKRLTSEQYYILRDHGTERAWTGKYNKHKGDGVYHCAGCGLDLYDSKTKFDSGTGWPSFFKAVTAKKLTLVEDRKYGMVRVELRCGRCDGHLGHVFNDGPQPTGKRHCINSAALLFKARNTTDK